MTMKTGDLIRSTKIVCGVRVGGAEKHRIEYYGNDYVVYRVWSFDGRDLGEQTMPRKLFDKNFEPIPNFFELGKRYIRHASWSIPAQLNDVNERFDVKQVERNGTGVWVAFGRLTVVQAADTWVLRDEYSWKNEKWELDK